MAQHRLETGLQMDVDEPCVCGLIYEDFRTELTFTTVQQMMYTGSEDPGDWRCRSRHAVLGYWRELKLQLWATHQGYCTNDE